MRSFFSLHSFLSSSPVSLLCTSRARLTRHDPNSASFDSTAKLWDAETGDCLHTFARHTDYVYSLQFSPGLGTYLATGSNDSKLCVWSMKVRFLLPSPSSPLLRTRDVGTRTDETSFVHRISNYYSNTNILDRFTNSLGTPLEPKLLSVVDRRMLGLSLLISRCFVGARLDST